MTWRETKLGDLGRVVTGKTPPRARIDYFGDHCPFISSSDFDHMNYYCTEFSEGLSESGLEKYRNIVVPRDAVMCVCIGTIGKCAIASQTCLTNQQINSIVCNKNNDPKFVYYLICNTRPQIQAIGLTGGSAQPIINKTIFSAIKVQVPDLKTQINIAKTLSAYDDLTENNRRRIALLEEAARLLYREWFVHFRFPGHEHVKIIDGLPEGWEQLYLGDVVTTQYGHTASASEDAEGPKFVRGTDINKQSFIDWSSVPYCPEQGLDFDKFSLGLGDILVIRMADPGKVAIVERPVRAVFASYLVRLKIKNVDLIPPYFMFMTLTDERYQGFVRASSGGATRKSASAKLLTDFYFDLPPKRLRRLFLEQVAPIRQMITNLVDQSARAAQARDHLLPRLMSGEIAV